MKSKRARDAVEADDKPITSVDVDVEAPPKKRKRSDDDSADVKKPKKDKKEKKDKKDKKDKKNQKESRKERKDKRKDLQDLPEQDDDEVVNGDKDVPMTDAEPSKDVEASSDKKDKKKSKKEKKDRKAKDADAQPDAPVADPETNGDSKDEKKKKKKSKKDTKAAKESTTTEADPAVAAEEAQGEDTAEKSDRHIVFVGNLPFTATATTIEAHFSSLSPSSVRCMSDPNDTKPCRGFAFVEFEKVWHMRTCLDKFHHSMFDDGVSPARRINVELTAGGGGKTKQRQEKIKEKNRKLDENRTKRIEREKNTKEENKANAEGEDYIHPSRRARVPGNTW